MVSERTDPAQRRVPPYQPTLFVVDDEEAVTHAIDAFARLQGLPCQAFHSAEDFFRHYSEEQPGCLVLDYKLPGRDGRQLQDELLHRRCTLPIIMISGHGTVEVAVEAMRRGAVTFLQKPFTLEELWQAVCEALELDRRRREAVADASSANALIATLTKKEREVLILVAAGKTNQTIASELRLSLRAVEDRRARMMRKLGMTRLEEVVDLYQRSSLSRDKTLQPDRSR